MKKLLISLAILIPIAAYAANFTTDNLILNPATGGTIQRNSASGDTTVTITNTDGTRVANLAVEGNISAGTSIGVSELISNTDVLAKIDNNNDSTGNIFAVRTNGNSTNLFKVEEDGDATFIGVLTGGSGAVTLTNANGNVLTAALEGADLKALDALSGTNTIYYRSAADTWTAVTIGSLLNFAAGTLNITDAELADVSDGIFSTDFVNTANPWAVNEGGTGSGTASGARTNLGLGTGDSPTFTGLTLSALLTGTQISLSSASNTLANIRTTTSTGGVAQVMTVMRQSSNVMVDDFGPMIGLYIRDTDAVSNAIVDIGGVRAGADNTGAFVVRPYTAGVAAEVLRVIGTGVSITGALNTTGNNSLGNGAGDTTTISGPALFANTALSANATQTWDSSLTREHSVTLVSGTTVTVQADTASSPTDRQLVLISMKQNASSASVVDWATGSKGFLFSAEALAEDNDEVLADLGSLNIFGFRYDSTFARWVHLFTRRFVAP